MYIVLEISLIIPIGFQYIKQQVIQHKIQNNIQYFYAFSIFLMISQIFDLVTNI